MRCRLQVARRGRCDFARATQSYVKVAMAMSLRHRTSDTAATSLLRHRKDTLTATSEKVAATSLRSPWRPKWLRFAMSPRRPNATSPQSRNGDVPATSLLRYHCDIASGSRRRCRLSIATAMSPRCRRNEHLNSVKSR